ncbi:MAG: pentapeptide repeat-containing protein [Gaiellaceae bacterium]
MKHGRWSLGSLVGPVLVIAVLAIVLASVFVLPELVVDRDLDGPRSALTPGEHLKATNDVRTTLLQGLAGLFFLATAYFTLRQIRISQQQLRVDEDTGIAQRFTHAVDQLGSETRGVRIGGIYALERIGRDRDADFREIAEILSALVRERALQAVTDAPIASTVLDADVQAALTVLARLPQAPDGRLDLSAVDLTGANLRLAHLDRVNLNGSRLARADLTGAHLNDALLVGTDFRSAKLERAELRGSVMIDARLEKAKAAGVDLRKANMTGSRVDGARLAKARLEGARLVGVNLAAARYNDLSHDAETVWPEGFELGGGELPPPAAAPTA